MMDETFDLSQLVGRRILAATRETPNELKDVLTLRLDDGNAVTITADGGAPHAEDLCLYLDIERKGTGS